MPTEPTVAEYLARRPTDEETARRAVRPYGHLTPRERLRELTSLLAAMDTLLAGRRPLRHPDDVEFWRHWSDPTRGRPR